MRVYITFGQVHVHRVPNATLDKDSVATFECATEAEGRKRAFDLFGDKWHRCITQLEDVHLEYFPRGLIEV